MGRSKIPPSEKTYTQEKILKKDLKILLNERGAKWFMPVPTGYSEGAVDFIMCYKGRYVATETKVHPNTMTVLQQDFLLDVIQAGGVGILAYHTDIVMRVLDFIDNDPLFWVRRIIGIPDVVG
jgi:hypothetical protein